MRAAVAAGARAPPRSCRWRCSIACSRCSRAARAGSSQLDARAAGSGSITPRLVGLGIVLLGLGLALPLPIPGSNLVFLIPLFIYAVGAARARRVWIVLGHLAHADRHRAARRVRRDGASRVLERVWHWLV